VTGGYPAPVTTYTLRSASPAKTRADVVVVGVLQGAKGAELAPGGEDVADAYGRNLRPLLAHLGVSGKPGEVVKVPTGKTIASGLLVLVGLGKAVTPLAVRRAAGATARAVTNAASVSLALPADTPGLVRAATEGWLLGGYTFTTYKQDTATPATSPGTVGVLSPIARQAEAIAAFTDAQVVAAAVLGTRDWVNTPPGDFTPERFVEAVTALHAEVTKGRGAPPLTLTVLDESALADLGCGGILGVGGGSSAPPRLVELSYRPEGAVAHVALVGKGITFDSGGLTIKPATGMTTMKCDMAGAAAVLQATVAVARLGLPVRVSAFAPMAENMVSGSAMRPGDVLTMYGGRTVEVQNTDAEGRLVLADALVRAREVEPDAILDVATLTGHMVLALGDRVGGVMGSDEVVQAVLAAGEAACEAQWPMPIPDDMVDRVRASTIADLLQHDWVRWGGGLYAAAFLREFTGDLPWAHLDIAGPAFNTGAATGDLTSGGTGFAVATLVEYVRSLASAD
jgi:leucyl aminopeptidase